MKVFKHYQTKKFMEPKKTVLLGMSGGVDSSIAALLLKKKGYNVIGAFMRNFSDIKNPLTGECNWIEERKMAQKIALLLNIPLITLNFEKQFKKYVIDYIFKSYKNGLTPNPDILCNQTIKFPLLWKEAEKIKADYIATGHYARIKKTKQGYQLFAGKDKTKDQSYFLSKLEQSDLRHTLFPLGNLTKSEIRKIAEKNNFPNWDKKGTAGICFVGKINMKSFLKKKIKEKQGKILDTNNNIIGHHSGTFYYTIGQRIGMEITSKKTNERLYVANKDEKTNTIIVVPENHPLLKKQMVKLENFHRINEKEAIPSNVKARIRHLGQLHKGQLIKKGNEYQFVFKKPINAIAEGQFLAIYSKDKLIGSGEMCY